MSTNGVNACEDAEMADCDGEKVVTMMDVLQEQEDFEEDANAVLGASDEKNCTYSKGYIKRQALYACMTCISDAKEDPTKRAGVCLACSLTCHENHDLIELYTKRNFRCDCGNPKFNSHRCQFTSDKTDLNEENVYNQNFSGVYCTCHRPYPDPDADTEQEMIQCIICEDWLHSSHLDAVVPPSDQYTEMICKACMDKNEFLHDYSDFAVNKENVDVDILNTSTETSVTVKCNGNANVDMVEGENIDSNAKEEKSDILNDQKDNNEINAQVGSEVTEESKETEKSEEPEPPEPSYDQTDAELGDESTAKESIANDEQDKKDEVVTPSETTVPTETTPHNHDAKEATLENETKSSEDVKTTDENITETEEIKTKSEEIKTEASEKGNDKGEECSKINDAAASEDSIENPDSRSQEQVEEDLLLADPVENVPSKNKETEATSDSTQEKVSEGKSDPQPMETNKSESTEDKTEKSDIKDNSESQVSSVSEQTISDEKEKSEIDESKTNETSEDTDKKDNKEEHSNDIDLKDNPTGTEILKRKLSSNVENDNSDVKKPKLDEKQCIRPKGVRKVYKGATFWPSNFRHKLCTCNECISMYRDLSVLFLTDPEDTVSAYERLGQERTDGKPMSQYEKGIAALSSLGHVQQINALTEYGKMRDKLLEFLKSFKEKKVIVKEEDIKAFFAGMKPVREPDGVYFCR